MKKKTVKVRRTWALHPATRIEKDRTKYDRAREKQRMLREEKGRIK